MASGQMSVLRRSPLGLFKLSWCQVLNVSMKRKVRTNARKLGASAGGLDIAHIGEVEDCGARLKTYNEYEVF